MKPHSLTPKTKLVFKFIFALGVWSFLVLGLVKLNNDQFTPQAMPMAGGGGGGASGSGGASGQPINGRLLLQKENKWTMEGTPKTTERFMQMITAEEVLVDNRSGKFGRRA